MSSWRAWTVHLYTATGAIWGWLATLAAVAGDVRAAFFWMFIATVVDSSDGWLARRARVKTVLPHFDGSRLDDIVDYLTFVFAPMLLLHQTGRLPGRWGLAVACTVLLASGYGFSRTDAKTADHFYTGFPSYWNVVAFYLYAAGTPQWVNGAVLLVLSGLIFVPMAFVYPSRTVRFRTVTVVLCGIWGVMVLIMLAELPAVRRWLLLLSLFFPVYYALLSFILHRRRRGTAGSGTDSGGASFRAASPQG